MGERDFRFLAELTCPPLELVFLRKLWHDPEDDLSRSAYADWLMEQGRGESSAHVRQGFTPGGRDKRREYPVLWSGQTKGFQLGSGDVLSGVICSGWGTHHLLSHVSG